VLQLLFGSVHALMNSGVYGTAEFRPGMEDVDDPVVPNPPEAPAEPTKPTPPMTPIPPISEPPADNSEEVVDATTAGNEGLSLMQKGLFLTVIVGAVAVYVKMNTRSSSRGEYSVV